MGFLDRLGGDLRFVVRSLAKRPLSAVAIVVTLALGIGATTAIVSVIQGVLLQPLPFPDSERLVLVLESNPGQGFPVFSVSALNYRDFRDANQSFERLALTQALSLNLTGAGDAERLFGTAVTGEFFEVLQLDPLEGRTIQPADDRVGAPRVVVLSHGLWQRRFGGDRQIVGQAIRLSGEPYEVIGVLPPDSYPVPRDFFTPLAPDYEASERGVHLFVGLGRLRPGVSIAGAQADLSTIAAALARTYPETNEGWGAVVHSWHGWNTKDLRPALLVLLAAVGAVLLVAVVNATNLMLARLATRERELAVRAALGAGRGDLARMALIESLLLTVVAGGLGLLISAWVLDLLMSRYAGELPLTAEVGLDGAVLLFALGLTLAVGLLMGLLPALTAGNLDLRSALAEGGGGTTGRRGRRLRAALVVVEVALSVVLLAGAGLLIRSFTRLAAVDPGLDAERVLTAQFELPGAVYSDDERLAAFYDRLAEQLGQLPGVRAAGLTAYLPLASQGEAWSYFIDGRPRAGPGEAPVANYRAIGGEYLEAMGVPLREGRMLGDRDDRRSPRVVLISESLARREWPDGSPLGQRLHLTFLGEEPMVWWEVVGVVGDVREADLAAPPRPTVYGPMQQAPRRQSAIVLATSGDPGTLAGPLRALMRRLDPTLPVFGVQSMRSIVDSSMAGARFNTVLVLLFAGLALLLAAVGVYGVIAYGVEQRRRELAVRQAFGAARGQIVQLVVRQGMRPVLWGFAVGVVGALAATRWLQAVLFGVGATDPVAWVGVIVVLGLVGLAACWLPARRAVRIDPWSALREE